jgi:hypothetical protein
MIKPIAVPKSKLRSAGAEKASDPCIAVSTADTSAPAGQHCAQVISQMIICFSGHAFAIDRFDSVSHGLRLQQLDDPGMRFSADAGAPKHSAVDMQNDAHDWASDNVEVCVACDVNNRLSCAAKAVDVVF